MTCDRCPGVEMTLQPLYEGSTIPAWYCPCCKAHLRTAEMVQADAELQAAEMGLTMDEYHDHVKKRFTWSREMTPEQLERARLWAQRQADEWNPQCEHVENPWLPKDFS